MTAGPAASPSDKALFSPQQTHYRPYHFGCHPNLHVNLRITLTHEQDPEILELCCLRLCFPPCPEWAFRAEFHGLRFGGADPHPSCEPFECLRPKEPHHPQTVTRSSGHDRSSYASAPTNPAYKNEKQYWWQRLALMEANSHHKRVRLTACIQKHREEIKKLVHFPRAWMKTPLILTVPFTPSVQSPSGYEGCLAAKNLQPQLATAASTMTQGNKSHLDSISVTSLEMQMMFQWWKMTIKRFVCQAFPADPHYLCLPGLSSPLNLSQHLFNLVPGGDQLAGLYLPSLSLKCPANTAADLMRSLQSWSLIFDQGCHGGKCTSSNQHSSPPTEHCSDLTEMPDAHQ